MEIAGVEFNEFRSICLHSKVSPQGEWHKNCPYESQMMSQRMQKCLIATANRNRREEQACSTPVGNYTLLFFMHIHLQNHWLCSTSGYYVVVHENWNLKCIIKSGLDDFCSCSRSSSSSCCFSSFFFRSPRKYRLSVAVFFFFIFCCCSQIIPKRTNFIFPPVILFFFFLYSVSCIFHFVWIPRKRPLLLPTTETTSTW